jgi:hypothetical protein
MGGKQTQKNEENVGGHYLSFGTRIKCSVEAAEDQNLNESWIKNAIYNSITIT